MRLLFFTSLVSANPVTDNGNRQFFKMDQDGDGRESLFNVFHLTDLVEEEYEIIQEFVPYPTTT